MPDKRATPPGASQPGPVLVPPPPPLDPIPHIMPFGGVSLIAGAAGTGKTALLAGFLRDLRQGKPVFGHQPSPIPAVGIITCDRGWERGAGFWFERAGFGEIPHYAMVDDEKFDPRSLRRKFDRTSRLLEMVDRLALPPRSLIAVDPIGMFLGGNLNDYDTCAVACLELRAGIRIRGLTLLGTAHSGKMKTDKNQRYLRLQDAILGSAALFGFGDTQMYLAAPDELGKSHYSLLWHPHEAKAEIFDLVRDENGLFVPYVRQDSSSCARVLALLPEDGSPITLAEVTQLAATIPLTQKTVQRTLAELIEQGLVVKLKHGTYRRVVTP